jgi:hypothetical protein
MLLPLGGCRRLAVAGLVVVTGVLGAASGALASGESTTAILTAPLAGTSTTFTWSYVFNQNASHDLSNIAIGFCSDDVRADVAAASPAAEIFDRAVPGGHAGFGSGVKFEVTAATGVLTVTFHNPHPVDPAGVRIQSHSGDAQTGDTVTMAAGPGPCPTDETVTPPIPGATPDPVTTDPGDIGTTDPGDTGTTEPANPGGTDPTATVITDPASGIIDPATGTTDPEAGTTDPEAGTTDPTTGIFGPAGGGTDNGTTPTVSASTESGTSTPTSSTSLTSSPSGDNGSGSLTTTTPVPEVLGLVVENGDPATSPGDGESVPGRPAELGAEPGGGQTGRSTGGVHDGIVLARTGAGHLKPLLFLASALVATGSLTRRAARRGRRRLLPA